VATNPEGFATLGRSLAEARLVAQAPRGGPSQTAGGRGRGRGGQRQLQPAPTATSKPDVSAAWASVMRAVAFDAIALALYASLLSSRLLCSQVVGCHGACRTSRAPLEPPSIITGRIVCPRACLRMRHEEIPCVCDQQGASNGLLGGKALLPVCMMDAVNRFAPQGRRLGPALGPKPTMAQVLYY